MNPIDHGHWVVTGAAGFIGHRVVEMLRARGREVVSVDLVGGGRDPFRTRLEHREVDYGLTIDREALLPSLLAGRHVRAIVHLGACTDTLEHDEAYLERFNVSDSQALWRYCTERRVPFIYASSAATYGAGDQGYDDAEESIPLLRPLNPYGCSKHRFDLWALEEERAGRSPPVWAGLKLFNVYGFGERHKGPMASMVLQAFDQIRRDGRVRLFRSERPGVADGEQRRDFVFVDDVVAVVLYLAVATAMRGIFNVGTGQARTFLDLAGATFRSLGKTPLIEFVDLPHALRGRYQDFTCAPMAKLRSVGYGAPFVSLEEGIERVVSRLRSTE